MQRKRRNKLSSAGARGTILDRLPASVRRRRVRAVEREPIPTRSSIGNKLIGIMVLTSGVALVVASLALIAFNYFSTRDSTIRDLKILSQVTVDNSAASLMFDNPAAARETMLALRVQPDIEIACLYDADGAFFADYLASQDTKCPNTAPAPGENLAGGAFTLSQSITFDGERVGSFVVRLGLGGQWPNLVTFALSVAIIAIVTLCAVYLLSAVLQRKLTGPLLELVGLTKAVTRRKDYALRAVARSHDEIGELIDAFNGMLCTVQERDSALTAAKETAEARSEELQNEIEIRRAAERERDQAIESMSEGFALWSADDRLIMCNSNYRDMFAEISTMLEEGVEYSAVVEAAVSCGLFDTEGLTVAAYVEQELHRHHNPTGAYERRLGKDRWVSISRRKTETGGVVGIWTDVSERRRSEDTIRELALNDPLTGLANRNRFHSSLVDAIETEVRQDQRVALLIVDLDHFKPVNDEFGHTVGDKLLRLAAERLNNATRDGDTVARLGGDEFAIIVRDLDRDAMASDLAQRIIQSLSDPIELDGRMVRTGASVGISVYPEHARDVEELIRTADVALYQAKAEGRGTYRIYDEELHESLRSRHKLEQELERAIENNEFVLHYQPQVSLDGDRLIGVEALVRWQHPERGLLEPNEFMSVAEASGLILRIDEWVLREACLQSRRWQAAGLAPIPVAVNVSARQFRSDDLETVVASVLEESQIDPDYLELEITEHMVMDDVDEASKRLSRLHDLGVRLAVDDFGTGYSSLSYLKKFPVWRLKIDRTFVRDIAESADDAAIIDAIIRLGRSLRLKVLAEGVETPDQAAALRRLGCNEVQGYLYCKPIPADDLADWATAHLTETAQARDLETVAG